MYSWVKLEMTENDFKTPEFKLFLITIGITKHGCTSIDYFSFNNNWNVFSIISLTFVSK